MKGLKPKVFRIYLRSIGDVALGVLGNRFIILKLWDIKIYINFMRFIP